MNNFFLFFAFINFGCQNTPIIVNEYTFESVISQNLIFKQVDNFPFIKDTTEFISSLIKSFRLEVLENPFQNEEITIYEKVKIYGSDNDFVFIEYDYKDGVGASYPWKFQILLTTEGRLIKILQAKRFEFVEILENENPFLLLVEGTFKGSVYHKIYKLSSDTLEKVFDGDFLVMNNLVKVFDPNELNFYVNDFNNDGYNDISFYGQIVYIKGQSEIGDWYDAEIINGEYIEYSMDNPFMKIPVEYIFIFDKQTGHFIHFQ